MIIARSLVVRVVAKEVPWEAVLLHHDLNALFEVLPTGTDVVLLKHFIELLSFEH